jgi:hypothetical protein
VRNSRPTKLGGHPMVSAMTYLRSSSVGSSRSGRAVPNVAWNIRHCPSLVIAFVLHRCGDKHTTVDGRRGDHEIIRLCHKDLISVEN